MDFTDLIHNIFQVIDTLPEGEIKQQLAYFTRLYIEKKGYTNAPRDGQGYWRIDQRRIARLLVSQNTKKFNQATKAIFGTEVRPIFISGGFLDFYRAYKKKRSAVKLLPWDERENISRNGLLHIDIDQVDVESVLKYIPQIGVNCQILITKQEETGVGFLVVGEYQSLDLKPLSGTGVKELIVKAGMSPSIYDVCAENLEHQDENDYFPVFSAPKINNVSISRVNGFFDKVLRKVKHDGKILVEAMVHNYRELQAHLHPEVMLVINELVLGPVREGFADYSLSGVNRAWEEYTQLMSVFYDAKLLKSDTEVPNIEVVMSELVKVPEGVNFTSYVDNYSMTVNAKIVQKFILEQFTGLLIVASNVEYFESSMLLFESKGNGDSLVKIQSINNLGARPDVIFSELHPGNPLAEHQGPTDIVGYVRNLVENYQYSSDEPLVLVIDATMNVYGDHPLSYLVESLTPLLQKGMLTLHVFQSCAKLFQLGGDTVPGGIYWGMGDHAITKPGNRSLMQMHLETYIAFLLHTNKDFIKQYAQMLRVKNQTLYQHLRGMHDTTLQLVHNHDRYTPYLSIKVESSDQTSILTEAVLQILHEGFGVQMRGSFGFSELNATSIKKIIRFSVGLESLAEIKGLWVEMVTLSEVVSCMKKLNLLGNENAVERFKEGYLALLREPKEITGCSNRSRLKLQGCVVDKAQLSIENEQYFVCYYDASKNRVIKQELLPLSRIEKLVIKLLCLQGEVYRMSVVFNDLGFDRVVLGQQEHKLFLEDDMQFQQTHGDVLQVFYTNESLSVEYQGKQYNESHLRCQQKSSGQVWVDVSRLPKSACKDLYEQFLRNEVEVKVDKANLRLSLGDIRVDLVSNIKNALDQGAGLKQLLDMVHDLKGPYAGVAVEEKIQAQVLEDIAMQYVPQKGDLEILIGLSEREDLQCFQQHYLFKYLQGEILYHDEFCKYVEDFQLPWQIWEIGLSIAQKSLKDIDNVSESYLEGVHLVMKCAYGCVSLLDNEGNRITRFVHRYAYKQSVKSLQDFIVTQQLKCVGYLKDCINRAYKPLVSISRLLRVYLDKTVLPEVRESIPEIIRVVDAEVLSQWYEHHPRVISYAEQGFLNEISDEDCLVLRQQDGEALTSFLSNVNKPHEDDSFWATFRL